MTLTTGVISDRRAHERRPFRTEALLTFADGQSRVAHVLDIGKGGVGLITDINAPLGYPFKITLRLPGAGTGGVPFEAHGSVANCILDGRRGGFRWGAQFKDLTPAALAALKGIGA